MVSVVFSISLSWKFYQYQDFISEKPKTIRALVLSQYPKKDYIVLKLKTTSGIVFTTSKEDLKDLTNSYVSVFGKTTKCSFLDFLQSCFFINFYMSLEHSKPYKNLLYDFIDSQHSDQIASGFYKTIFLASPLPNQWRDIAPKLGISHLLAISGFHLGILALFFYSLMYFPYEYFHSRYFTYRHIRYDLGALTLAFLFGYLILLDFQPAFFRAFVMSLAGFLLFFCGLRFFSFQFLFACALISIAIFPNLIFSIGFFLSVMGVFYIYLFVKYFNFSFIKNKLLKASAYLVCFNAVLYLNMLPISLFFFHIFSSYSLLSIPISIAFGVFFVISIFLHFVFLGGIFDGYLSKILELDLPFSTPSTPLWFFVFFIFLSLLSTKYKKAYFALLLLSVANLAFILLGNKLS